MPIGFLAIVAVGGAVVMLLWNWLMPAIFGLGAVSFWQALGILVLCRLLFGRVKFGGMRHRMRNPIHKKWQKMTPEERKEFLQNRRFGRCFGQDFHRDDKFPKQD